MDIHVNRITGGIKAYRKYVLDTLEHKSLHAEAFVLHGLTGTGKTAVLDSFSRKATLSWTWKGWQDIAARFWPYRLQANNQKTFDSELFERLKQLESSPYLLFEAESKRIGKIAVPDFMKKKESG